MKKDILVVCGPTATGKTNLGIKLSKKLNGEIISADSRQVYQYLDIGTGKDLPENSVYRKFNLSINLTKKHCLGFYTIKNVKIWLYDVIKPSQMFSAGEYAKLAWTVINDIWKQGKLPILVGGTGFYIKAVVDGFKTIDIPPNLKLRKKIENLRVESLRTMLKKLDLKRFSSMNKSDKNNPRRIVRAIEVACFKKNHPNYITALYHSKIESLLIIGLTASKKTLYKQIDKRVEKRLKQGIVKEIKGLLKKGYSWDDPGLKTIGYKEWKGYFAGKTTKEEVVDKWKHSEHSYAKRQLTWFKKDKRIKWFNINSLNLKEIISCVRERI